MKVRYLKSTWHNYQIRPEDELTKREQKEDLFQTLGRLKARIYDTGDIRSIVLFEKIINDISELDIKLNAK